VAALRWLKRRPALWIELGVAAAWIALVLDSTLAQGQGDGSGWTGGPLWVCELGTHGGGGGGHAGSSAVIGGSLLAGVPMWGLMATAMMVPTALPAIHHVGGKSMFWRRRRATVEFIAIFLGLWVAFAAVVLGGLGSWGPAGSPYALAVALALAALWQLTPLKLRAMRACHRSRPLPPRGWRATAGVADFALHNGGACIASCWAMMAAVSLAHPGSLWWMGALTGAMAAEKLAEKPRRIARRLAALLAAAAIGVALAATF
jgi:predicted metal-binding membrane protein